MAKKILLQWISGRRFYLASGTGWAQFKSFSPGGEALLKPFAVDLVAHGSSIGLFVELLSHGYWEDQSKIEGLGLARPWRITISLDGIGEIHSLISGRPHFFERTSRTLETLNRVRKDRGLRYGILLKTVIMAHNLDGACDVAHYIWENRPQWWRGGCCFDQRCSETEMERLALASIQEPIRERS